MSAELALSKAFKNNLNIP